MTRVEKNFALGSERILIVEDDAEVRAISARILREQGYILVEASNGDQAISYLENEPPFDLLFSDIILPGPLNGLDIAEQAQRIQPGIKILYTTGYAESPETNRRLLESGAPLLKKPFRRNQLLETVDAMFDHGNTGKSAQL